MVRQSPQVSFTNDVQDLHRSSLLVGKDFRGIKFTCYVIRFTVYECFVLNRFDGLRELQTFIDRVGKRIQAPIGNYAYG